MATKKLIYSLTFETIISSDEEELAADLLVKTIVANNMPATVNLVASQKQTQNLSHWNF